MLKMLLAILSLLVFSACSPTNTNTNPPQGGQTGTIENTGSLTWGNNPNATGSIQGASNGVGTGNTIGTGASAPQGTGTWVEDADTRAIMNDLDSIFKDIEGTK